MAKPTPAQIIQGILDVLMAIGMAIIGIFK